jgi:hypothetical protein
MLDRRHFVGAIVAATAVLAAGGALAQGQAIAGISTTTETTSDARIAAADVAGRTVTLVMPDGSSRTAKVSSTVASLGSANVGDVVTVRFEEKRTFVLSGPNTKTPGDRSTTIAAAGQVGSTKGAVAADKSITTWWVTAVDTAGNTISVVDPAGGQVRTLNVQDAAARANLSRVKPGDALTAIQTDILAVSLTKK